MSIAVTVALLVPFYAQANVPQSNPKITLIQKDREQRIQTDKRLQVPIAGRELKSGSVRSIGTWVKEATQLTLGAGTNEQDILTAKDYFIFNKVNAAELMEAYSTLYRLRWVAFKSEKITYLLMSGKDQTDLRYQPSIRRREQANAATGFVNMFDKLSDSEKAAVLGGNPLKYSELSPEMQGAFKNTLEASIDSAAANAADKGLPFERPDNSDLSEATIGLTEKSKPGTGVRELWIAMGIKRGSYSFRWNNYDSKKGEEAAKPIEFSQEPESNEAFSRKRMLEREKKLTSLLVTVPEGKRSLAVLLKYLSENYGLNFITNEDRGKQPLEFGCEELPLAEALDKISELYGNWEWEASPGDFLVMRSAGNPRRRDLKANP